MARRRKALGLLGSKSATHNALNLVKRQLVLDQLAKDPSGQTGPRLICEDIVFYTGILLTRSAAMSRPHSYTYWGFTTFENDSITQEMWA